MTHLWIKLLLCICSWLLCDNQIDLPTKTKRSRSSNPTPIPCNRTDLAIWPLSSGTGIIGLMALIITAVLLICHWLCAVDSHSVIDTCSKPVLYPTSGCFTCVGECWWLPHAHPETEQFLSMAPHFLFLYVCRFSKFRIVFVCICFHSSEFCSLEWVLECTHQNI